MFDALAIGASFAVLLVGSVLAVLRYARDLPGTEQIMAPLERRLDGVVERLGRIEERLPRVIAGRYRLQRQIGEGATGEVWQAYDEALRQETAIKLVHPHLTDDLARERFLREARVAARLRHPNVITMLDVGTADGQPYLAMELLRGVTLRDLPLPLDTGRVIEIGAQVADALIAAAALGMVHRDLKPDNICVEDEGRRFVIVDFGLAFLQSGDELLRTENGPITGTPHYMAPEQARNDELTGAADVYSLGCTLYELATGEAPFSARTARAMFIRHAQEPRPKLPDTEGVSGELSALIQQMMALDPNHRPRPEAVRRILRDLQREAA